MARASSAQRLVAVAVAAVVAACTVCSVSADARTLSAAVLPSDIYGDTLSAGEARVWEIKDIRAEYLPLEVFVGPEAYQAGDADTGGVVGAWFGLACSGSDSRRDEAVVQSSPAEPLLIEEGLGSRGDFAGCTDGKVYAVVENVLGGGDVAYSIQLREPESNTATVVLVVVGVGVVAGLLLAAWSMNKLPCAKPCAKSQNQPQRLP